MTTLSSPDSRNADGVIATFPLSPTQMQLWHQEMMSPGNPSLNVAVRWGVEGSIADDVLERAFQAVIERHEILRTRIVEQDGMPVQQVLGAIPFKLTQLDIRATPGDLHTDRIAEIEREEAAKPFDIATAGMLRAVLVRASSTKATLLIVAHHIVFDGFSIGVLGEEIGRFASAFATGGSAQLDPMALQYGDYALWQRDLQDSPQMQEETAFWTENLRDAPYFEIEPDLPRPARRGWTSDMVSIDLAPGFGEKIATTSKRLGISNFSLGASVASAVLHRFTGQGEVLFATPIACRSEVELEALIGPLISNQILRLATDDRTSFAQHARASHETVKAALSRPNMAFSKLVECLNPPRSLNRTPLVSVDFMLQSVFMQDRNYGDFSLTSRQSTNAGAARDLSIVLIGRPAGWTLNLLYSTELFKPQTIRSLGEDIARGFDLALSDASATLAEFPGQDRRISDKAHVTPRTAVSDDTGAQAVEARLTQIWSDILDLRTIDRDKSFFELGGHSLLAVRLMARIRDEWDGKLGVATIYEHPTVAALAQEIVRTTTPTTNAPARPAIEDWQIEPIQSNGTAQPIISINEIGLTSAFLKHLGQKHPASCIRLFDAKRGLDQSRKTFEGIAQAYADTIRAHQPTGPYLMFGVCVHGNIALEAARILQAEGAEIAGVVIKDVWEPGYVAEMKSSFFTRNGEKLHSLLTKIRHVKSGQMSAGAMLGSFRVIRRSGLLHIAAALGLIDRVRRSDLAEEQENFLDYISAARNVYRPASLSVPVLHIVTSISCTGAGYSPSLGWEKIISPGLKTVHMGEVALANGRETGTEQLAREIEQFLAEPWGKTA